MSLREKLPNLRLDERGRAVAGRGVARNILTMSFARSRATAGMAEIMDLRHGALARIERGQEHALGACVAQGWVVT